MNSNLNVSESAFLVNEFRARNEAESRDIYAKLWVTDKTREIAKRYDEQVSPHALGVILGIRNRYFLACLESELRLHPDLVFVNVAAGFTSYPFLVNGLQKSIEIDFPHVIEYKERKLKEFQDQGKLPFRIIRFLPADLNRIEDEERLSMQLKHEIAVKPSLVFMEGLTYYLDSKSLSRLVTLFSNLQTPGSLLVLDAWASARETEAVCSRFRKFLADHLNYPNIRYNYLDVPDLNRLAAGRYEIVELTNMLEKEKEYLGPASKPRSERFSDISLVTLRKN